MVCSTIAQTIQRHTLALPPPETIHVHVDGPTLIAAAAELHLMQRSLSNLIANAAQTMSRAGVLTIGAAAEDGAVAIIVHDTGEGVRIASSPLSFQSLKR